MSSTAPKTPRPVAEASLFHQIDRLAARSGRGAWIDRLLGRLGRGTPRPSTDWAGDAFYAQDRQEMLHTRRMLYVIVATVLLLLAWMAFTPIDEVTRGEGKLIPSRQLQVVQAVDGGVVEEIFVKEGQRVAQGDLLVRIDPTRFAATFREGSAKAVALRAKVDRLNALLGNRPYQPSTPAASAGTDAADTAVILAQERQFYAESINQLNERLAIARQQLAQRQQELNQVDAALSQAERSHQMATQELSMTRPLLRSGAVSDMDILRLERDVSNADGERKQARARRAQLSSGLQEAMVRVREVEVSIRNQWLAELSTAQAELNSLTQNVTGLADRVKSAEIRSPVNGVVQRVLFSTLGGVVQPGHAVAEVVPSEDKLLVEARVAPRDIAFLRPDLPATVKFTAYDFTVYGGMPAKVQHISADSITDDKGNTYYLVRAETDSAEFKPGLPVIPGMTVQLDILTGKKTILAYLLKPLLRARQNAFTER